MRSIISSLSMAVYLPFISVANVWQDMDDQMGGVLLSPTFSRRTVGTNGLNLHMLFEDNSGTTVVLDDSKNWFDGTSYRNTSLVSTNGKIGKAFNFNYAAGDYITVPTNAGNFSSSDAWSVSLWFNCSSQTSANPCLIGKTRDLTTHTDWGWSVFLVGGLIYVQINSGTGYGNNEIQVNTISELTLQDGNWHHVVVTYNGNKTASGLTHYIDNVGRGWYVGRNTLTGPATNNMPVSVGGCGTGNIRYNGLLDDIRIYNYVITPSQVSALYNGGTGTQNDQ